MIERDISAELIQMSQQYPIVTLMGPRQSGKTTLIKNLFANKPYVNLEPIDTREIAERDPRGFLSQFPDGAILDEIQNVPNLLSYIQVIVDEKQAPGMFILTGSHQLQLHQAITQSLAGRTALLTLLPLSFNELPNINDKTIDEIVLAGFYPGIHKNKLEPRKAYANYLQT